MACFHTPDVTCPECAPYRTGVMQPIVFPVVPLTPDCRDAEIATLRASLQAAEKNALELASLARDVVPTLRARVAALADGLGEAVALMDVPEHLQDNEWYERREKVRTLLRGDGEKPSDPLSAARVALSSAFAAYQVWQKNDGDSETFTDWAMDELPGRRETGGDGEKPKCGTCGGTKRVVMPVTHIGGKPFGSHVAPCPDCAAAEKKTEG